MSGWPEVRLDSIADVRLGRQRSPKDPVTWAFDHDRSLQRPYESNLSALLHEPSFKALAGDRVFKLAKEVVRLGNRGGA